MSNFLKIGLSACFFHADPERPIFKNKTLLYFEESMAKMVFSYGAIPLLLPRRADNISATDILNQVDGLLLQGGSDLSPITYNEDPMKSEWGGDKPRDEYEIELVREAMSMNKPVLGICRGLQLINAALGGSLYQDINTQMQKSAVHRNWEVYDGLTHEIDIEPDTRLDRLYKNIKQRKIVSIHHQAVKDLGEDLVVEARSKEDGIIEAARYQTKNGNTPYVFGVQWHPEFQDDQDRSFMSHEPILKDFLSACG